MRVSLSTSLLGLLLRRRRDCLQPCSAQQRHVDRGRGHQQTLVGADVRSRLAAANVLLARLQRQREALLAVEIDRCDR